MKKLLLSLTLVLTFCFSAFGASSDDVYLRRDVFEAKMDALMAEIRLGNEQLRREIDGRFNQVDKRFNSLEKQIAVIDERTEATKTTVYWILAILGIIIALPFTQRFLQLWDERKAKHEPSFTLEDVKRLIDERFEANKLGLAGK